MQNFNTNFTLGWLYVTQRNDSNEVYTKHVAWSNLKICRYDFQAPKDDVVGKKQSMSRTVKIETQLDSCSATKFVCVCITFEATLQLLNITIHFGRIEVCLRVLLVSFRSPYVFRFTWNEYFMVYKRNKKKKKHIHIYIFSSEYLWFVEQSSNDSKFKRRIHRLALSRREDEESFVIFQTHTMYA